MFDFKDYFEFSEKMIKGELRVTPLDDYFINEYDFLACKEDPFEEPVFVRHMGARVYDVIPSSYPGIYLISRKFVNVLETNNFTGWKTYSARVYDKENKRVKDYYGFRICGKCGPHIESMSKDVMVEFPAGEFPGKKGLFFDPKTYDGSDIFLLKKSTHIIMHYKVKNALEKANITNAEFVNITEYTYSW